MYPATQNAGMDQTDNNDNIIPGGWRNSIAMHDLGVQQRENVGTIVAQQQKLPQDVLQQSSRRSSLAI